jgi:hypothetical protein
MEDKCTDTGASESVTDTDQRRRCRWGAECMKLSTGDVTGGGEPESKYQTSSLVGWLGV